MKQCPGNDPTNASRGCGLCNPPPENAFYIPKQVQMVIRSADECLWVCQHGFYNKDFSRSCTKCTEFNSTTCPAGWIFSPCSVDRDASCSRKCNDTDTGIPSSHAAYVLTFVDSEKSLQMADTDTSPNMGCLWQCNPPYVLSTTDGGLNTCRLLV